MTTQIQRVAWTALAVAATALGACSSDDIGQPCTALLEDSDASSDGASTSTQELVGQDVAYPCEEFICVASEGTGGYCSKKCRTDSGCPDGFTCRVIQTVGPFADQKFCAWKHCETKGDCGSLKGFYCIRPICDNEELKLCAFEDDTCP